ncbi:hypothetical protein [Streptomyces sp. NPDC088554]|uniref:hypothetical protein n=1 Tax=Streptomyces sp. NPDC088554 TaxID=3365865 RepID=UPI00380153EC
MATPLRMPAHHRTPWHRASRVSARERLPQGSSRYGPPHSRDRDRGHRLSPLALGSLLLLGIGYGGYTSAIARSGGAATYRQLALALISGAVLAALTFALVRVQHSLIREVRAAAWGTLTGCAVGFLYSLTGQSVLLSTGIGLVLGVSAFLVLFYLYYTREP